MFHEVVFCGSGCKF